MIVLLAAGLIRLFDGMTLSGWEGDPAMFRVEAGAIVAGSLEERIPHNYFLCTTRAYADFELALEVKLVGEGANAGIQFRSKRTPNHHEVVGYQADMGMGWWGALYDESRRDRILAAPEPALIARILKPEDWNEYRIRCEGARIRLWLNGALTVDFTETDSEIPRDGVIGLQIHGGGPSAAYYRNIRLQELGTAAEAGAP